MTTHLVQCPCRGLKGDDCPRCRGFGTYVAPGPDPDPLRAPGTDSYVVPPRPPQGRVYDGPGPAGVVVWLTVVLVIAATVALLWLITYGTAPRSSPDPTAPQPGASGVIGSVDTSARVPVGASGPSSSGAPLTQAVSPDPSLDAASGRQAGGAPLRGVATWYDAPSIRDAAAGPALRRALGPTWRGSWVRVEYVGEGYVAAIAVRLTDWCACGPRGGRDTLIDLDDRAFSAHERDGGLGVPLGRGVIRVSIESIDGVPEGPTLPPTDEEKP